MNEQIKQILNRNKPCTRNPAVRVGGGEKCQGLLFTKTTMQWYRTANTTQAQWQKNACTDKAYCWRRMATGSQQP